MEWRNIRWLVPIVMIGNQWQLAVGGCDSQIGGGLSGSNGLWARRFVMLVGWLVMEEVGSGSIEE